MKKPNIILITIVLIGLHSSAKSQYYNLEPNSSDANLIGLRTNIPMYKDENDYYQASSFSGSYTVYGLFKLKNDWSLYSEVPFIIAKNDYEKESGLGNILVIFRKALNENKTSHISFGTYLPTAGKNKYFKQDIGIASNIYRIPQVLPAVSIYGNYQYNIPDEKQGIFGFEAGPDILIPTVDGDLEFLLHFGMKGGYKFSKFFLWSEFNGIIIISESGMDLSDRIFSQLVFAGQVNLGKIAPGIFYAVPLKKDTREYISGIIGVKLGIEL